MGKMITLTAGDGFKLAAYEAPAVGQAKGNLVLVQEIFGVNRHIKAISDKWASRGYRVVAPALFDRVEKNVDLGYGQDDFTKGRETRGKLALDNVVADVRAAADYLGKPGTAAILGYCFGGFVTFVSSCRLSFAAAAGYYGGSIVNHMNEKPKCPTILHFGALDKAIPLTDVDKIKAARTDVTVYVYDKADHGFCCDERPTFHAESCKTADERSMALFAKNLKA
ncbi:MAG: dienelactone hydrolase family protein [Alphaproteobacteria bacterium]|nr:dienelactone hydrolase family protein [Alphaproteobacteria bacterium]